MEHTKEERSKEVFETLDKMLRHNKAYNVYRTGSIVTIKAEYLGSVATRDIFNYLTTSQNLNQLHFCIDFVSNKVIVFIKD